MKVEGGRRWRRGEDAASADKEEDATTGVGPALREEGELEKRRGRATGHRGARRGRIGKAACRCPVRREKRD